MKVIPTTLAEVLIIEPTVHRDDRGFFLEAFHAPRYRQAGIDVTFVQANQSRSVKDTLRGLHWQEGVHPQAKLIRVVVGEVFDVAVDVRQDSPTFGQWVGVDVSASNFRQLYVPVGFAHGFCVRSDVAEVEYLCSDVYDPASERGLIWNDPDLAIAWPVARPLISARDQAHPTLKTLKATMKT